MYAEISLDKEGALRIGAPDGRFIVLHDHYMDASEVAVFSEDIVDRFVPGVHMVSLEDEVFDEMYTGVLACNDCYREDSFSARRNPHVIKIERWISSIEDKILRDVEMFNAAELECPPDRELLH